MTLAAVITDETCHYKHAGMDYCLIPRYAFLDPGLSCSLPPDMTAYSGMDAMTHAVEAYCNRFCSPKMKAHAMKAVSLIGANLLTAYREPANKAARMNMLTGSYEAGIAFTNAYVGYVHAIAHGIGGLYHVPHGEANAILLPKVLAAYGSAVYEPLARLERKVRAAWGKPEREVRMSGAEPEREVRMSGAGMERKVCASGAEDGNSKETDAVLDRIPDDASVTATTFLVVPLSRRAVLYDLRYCSQEHLLSTDYVVVETTDSGSLKPYAVDGGDGLEGLTALLRAAGYAQLPDTGSRLQLWKRP